MPTSDDAAFLIPYRDEVTDPIRAAKRRRREISEKKIKNVAGFAEDMPRPRGNIWRQLQIPCIQFYFRGVKV